MAKGIGDVFPYDQRPKKHMAIVVIMKSSKYQMSPDFRILGPGTLSTEISLQAPTLHRLSTSDPTNILINIGKECRGRCPMTVKTCHFP